VSYTRLQNRFLIGTLDEDIYIQQPTNSNGTTNILKLKKAIYGLKQAPRQWYLRPILTG
jgi:hypothetical protein